MDAEGDPESVTMLAKRMLPLTRMTVVASIRVNRDRYVAFMHPLQPNAHITYMVPMNCPDVQESCRTSLFLVIGAKRKPKKSRSTYEAQKELFKHTTDIFPAAALAILREVTSTAHVPLLSQSGLLVPIYNQKYDQYHNKNNRSV